MTAAPYRVKFPDSETIFQDMANFAGRHAVPILALSPAAYISWRHMAGALAFDPIASVIIAAAIEVTGYVTVDTLIAAMNARRWVVFGVSCVASVGYLIIILTLNLSMDIALQLFPAFLPLAKVLAGGALIGLSVPASLWAAARQTLIRAEANEAAAEVIAANERAAIRAEDRAERAQIRAEKQAKRTAVVAAPVVAQPQLAATGATKAERAAAFIAGYYAMNGKEPSLKEIGEAISVKASMASEYRKAWRTRK